MAVGHGDLAIARQELQMAGRPRAGAVPGELHAGLSRTGRLVCVPIVNVVANPDQPRRRFDQAALQALADSIAERGILQPPIARELPDGRYELIAGERRWRASQLAGLVEIEVLIRDYPSGETLIDALIENVVRRDLTPIEEARAYATLIVDLGVTREALARTFGRSRASISNHLRLLELPDEVLDMLDDGRLSFSQGRALLAAGDQAARRTLARRAVAVGLSVVEIDRACKQLAPAVAGGRQREGSADREELARRIGEAVSHAQRLEIVVRAGADGRFTFTVEGHEAALQLAEKLGAADVLDGF
jgi:ParB family transcriptional regulator, chromosome partitioning protein